MLFKYRANSDLPHTQYARDIPLNVAYTSRILPRCVPLGYPEIPCSKNLKMILIHSIMDR